MLRNVFRSNSDAVETSKHVSGSIFSFPFFFPFPFICLTLPFFDSKDMDISIFHMPSAVVANEAIGFTKEKLVHILFPITDSNDILKLPISEIWTLSEQKTRTTGFLLATE